MLTSHWCEQLASISIVNVSGGTNALTLENEALHDENPVSELVLVTLNRALQTFIGVSIFMGVSVLLCPDSAVKLIRMSLLIGEDQNCVIPVAPRNQHLSSLNTQS